MNLYPLKFKPIYKEKIWGGQKIQNYFNRNLSSKKIGESWEVAAHKNGTSTVMNGSLAGKKLDTLINTWPQKMMGTVKLKTKKFPLLIKLLDANKKLSIQVHPNSNYAQLFEKEMGKTEMWYVITAEPGAKLIHGFKKTAKSKDIRKAIKNGNLEDYLNKISVNPGDIFFIPAGTVHGIEEGIMLAEIQQNSDTTYRLYDWNRSDKFGKKRPLHIERALTVANINCTHLKSKNKPLTYKSNNYNRHYLAACPHFITEKIDIKKEYTLNTASKKFYILIVLKGKGNLYHKGKNYKYTPGQTFYLPASLGNINISGKSEILITYLPDSRKKFVNKLLVQEFNENEITNLAGINIWNNML